MNFLSKKLVFIRQYYSGFTLIELLVVIAIIGVLATASLIYFNHSRAQSRDAGRVSDIQKMQDAVELYVEDHGSLPAISTWDNFVRDIQTYYKGDFSGQSEGHPYAYCHIPNTDRYMVAALLEGKEDINGDIDGMQYDCNKCVYSPPNNYICTPNPNCNDVLGGFLRNNYGTVICLGRPSD